VPEAAPARPPASATSSRWYLLSVRAPSAAIWSATSRAEGLPVSSASARAWMRADSVSSMTRSTQESWRARWASASTKAVMPSVDARRLGVVAVEVDAGELAAAVGQRVHEGGHAERDDDRGQHQRLRHRVRHRCVGAVDDRARASRTRGDDEEQVGAVAQEQE